ncbi:MAG: fibronectin type III domain-containing protein, partial [Euryarchaeota archaeon]|nr:fibronectin type III domain-containing protein [Euryarchaeota archaeon]
MRKTIILATLLFASTFSSVNAASMRQTWDGNTYDDWTSSNSKYITDCTPSSHSAPCDNESSVVVGASGYNGGSNSVIYDLTINEIAECVDTDMQIRLDIQTNGPNNANYGQVANRGWVAGQSVNATTSGFATMSKVVVYAYDWNGNPSTAPSDWDMIDGNSKIIMETGLAGTIATTNRGTGFAVEVVDIPKDGTVSLTNRDGTYLETDTSTSGTPTTSSLKIRVLNDPQSNWPASSGHLRTEIRSIAVDYDDETLAPTNPSGDYWTSQRGNQQFINNTWTKTRNFVFEKDVGADDDCDFDHLEYVVLPNGTNPNTATSVSFSTTTNPKKVSSVWIPSSSTSGVYKFWYRAVDGFGNEANWINDANFEILYDNVAPVAGTTSANYSPAAQWFNDASLPSLEWSGWSDAHATIKHFNLSYDGSSPHASYLSNTTSSWTATSSNGLTCGLHYFKLKAFDHASPVSNTRLVSVSFNFDNCAPNAAEISLPDSNWYTTNTPSVAFSPASESTSVQSGIASCVLYINNQSQGVLPSNVCTSQTGSATINLLDGSYIGYIMSCDVAGNCANGSEQFVRVDTISPTLQATTIRSPPVNVWGTNPNLNLSLSFTDTNPGNTTISQMDRAYALVVNSTSTPTISEIKNGSHFVNCSTNSCTLDIEQTLGDGNWSVWHVSYDNAGNVLGPNKVSSGFMVDTTPPSSTTPYFAANLTNSTSMTVLWAPSSDSGSSVVNYYLNVTKVETSTEISNFIGPNTTYLLSGLTDGNYSVCLVPVDAAGNHGGKSCSTTNLWVDSTAPTLQAWSDVDGWTSQNQVSISWLAEDASMTAQVRYALDNGTISQALPSNHSVILSSLSAGIHHVLVSANDSAGNTADVLLTFGIDPTPPVIQAYHHPGQSWTNQSSHTISWNISDTLSGIDNVMLYLNGALVQDNLTSNGSWMFNFTSGTHNITIIASDDVGLNSTWTSYARVDTATPALSCSVTPGTWSATTPSFFFDVLSNGSISNVIYVVKYDGNLLNVPSPGTVTLPTSLDGFHNVTVEASNQGGNIVGCRTPVFIDTAAPSLISYPNLPAVLNSSRFNISLDLFDLHAGVDRVDISLDGILLSSSQESDIYPQNVSSFSDGEYVFKILVVDAASNQMNWTTSIVLDRGAPVLDIFRLNSSTTNGWLNQSTAEIEVAFSDVFDSSPTGTILVNGVSYQAAQGSNFLSLDNGLNVIQILVRDHGNLEVSDTLIVNVDTIVPGCVLTGAVSSNTWANNLIRDINNSITFGPSGYTTSLSINGLAYGEINDNVSVSLENGSNQLSAIILSQAGLSSTCTLEQLVDARPDAIELDIEPTQGNYGDGFVSLRLHGNLTNLAPGVAQLIVNGIAVENYSYDSNVDEIYVLELDTGTHIISVQTIDAAGNVWVSESQAISVIIDNLPPEVGCKFETNHGHTSLYSNTAMNTLSFASGNKKIECFVEDFQENPIDFTMDVGEITVRYDGLPMASLTTLVVTETGFVLSLSDDDVEVIATHFLDITVRDMWGNTETTTYNLSFIRADREVKVGCLDDIIDDGKCQVSYPLVGQKSDETITLIAQQYIHLEPGFEWWLQNEQEALYISSNLEFEGSVQATSNNIITIHILDLLKDNNLTFAERDRMTLQIHANTTYGPQFIRTITVEFQSCPDGYAPNHEDLICVANQYLGPTVVWNSTNGELARNTTQLEFDTVLNQLDQTDVDWSCAIEQEKLNWDEVSLTLKVPINETIKTIQIVCEDENGFNDTTKFDGIRFQEVVDLDPSATIPQVIVVGATLLLLFLAIIVLIIRKRNPKNRLETAFGQDSKPSDEQPQLTENALQTPSSLLPSNEDSFDELLLEAESETPSPSDS